MWSHSDRFEQTIQRNHDVLAYVEFLVDGEVALTVGTDQSADTILTAGVVHVAEGVTRQTASLTLADPGGQLTPVADQGLLIPGRQCEIRVWAGVRYWDWTQADVVAGTDVEYVPRFTGPITSVDLRGYPAVRIEAADRMWYCQEPFTNPFVLAGGITLDDGIRSILALKVPPSQLDTNIPGTPLTTKTLTYDEQADPADKLRELATAAGWTLYVDSMGTFVAEDEPEPVVDAVVLTYTEGDDGALIEPALALSAQNIRNTWVVEGASGSDTLATPRAVVTDNDPASLTYVRGPWDERTRFITSPILLTDAQCQLAAMTYRRREGGLADSLVARVFPNPAAEKGDVYLITGGLVTNRLIIADSFDLDLFGAEMAITARAGAPADQDA